MSLLGIDSLNPASLALLATPAGPAAALTSNFLASVGQRVISQLASNMHLGHAASQLAQARISYAMGDSKGAIHDLHQAQNQLAKAYRASSTEQGDQQRQIDDIVKRIVDDVSQSDEMKRAKGGGKGAGAANGGGSWLMAIAQVLGDKLNSMAHELTGLAQQAADDPSASTMFGAKSQEFGILMNSANTGLKSIGDGLQTMAKRN